MNTTERKQVLLQRLSAVDGEQQLQEIEDLIRQSAGEILHFSSELRIRIDEALEQVRDGRVCSTAEMGQQLKPWSGK